MNILKKYRVFFLIPFLFMACEDWLDDPTIGDQLITETFFTSVEDLEKVLNGSYATLLGVEGEGLASAPFFIAALGGDFVAPVAPNYENIPDKLLNEYRRQHLASGENSMGLQYLKYLSRAANTANMVIDALENGSLEDDPDFTKKADRLLGEAYMMRALCNFEITKLVGKQYNESTSGSDPAGYYSLKPIFEPGDLPAERKTVEASYTQLIIDIQKAIELLPVEFDSEIHSPFYGTRRFTKDAARALNAKIYFQKNDFSNAKILVDSILGPTPGEPDRYPLVKLKDLAKDVVWSNEDEPYGPSRVDEKDAEIICDFYGDSEDGPTADNNVFGAAMTPDISFGEPGRSKIDEEKAKGYFAMSEYFKTYCDFDFGDGRFQSFLDEIPGEGFNGTTNYWWPIKFANDGINIMWYRSAEFMLMRAECNARLGNDADAIDDLNAIKDRAGIDFYEDDPFRMPTLLEEIIRERAREMFLENYRYWELLRLGSLGETILPNGDRFGDDAILGDGSGVSWDNPELLYDLP